MHASVLATARLAAQLKRIGKNGGNEKMREPGGGAETVET